MAGMSDRLCAEPDCPICEDVRRERAKSGDRDAELTLELIGLRGALLAERRLSDGRAEIEAIDRCLALLVPQRRVTEHLVTS